MSEHVDKMLSEHGALSFEVIELREALAQKDAAIKALADALWRWRHLLMVEVPGVGPALVADVAAALRIAGRL